MSDRGEAQTYYEILEIQPTAGPTEIYNAYQKARSTYSPNSPALYSMFTPQEAQQLMALIEEAYQTLSHQGKRKDYDVKIGIAVQARPRSTASVAAVPKASTPQSGTPIRPPQNDKWVGSVRVASKSREELPQGFARTKFSVYEIKPEVEQEIASVEQVNGAFLQKVRLYRGVTLDQMSEEIRVIKSTLVALEADDLDALPVAVFTRGFVVQYSRCLALDEKKISDAYMKYFRAEKN